MFSSVEGLRREGAPKAHYHSMALEFSGRCQCPEGTLPVAWRCESRPGQSQPRTGRQSPRQPSPEPLACVRGRRLQNCMRAREARAHVGLGSASSAGRRRSPVHGRRRALSLDDDPITAANVVGGG